MPCPRAQSRPVGKPFYLFIDEYPDRRERPAAKVGGGRKGGLVPARRGDFDGQAHGPVQADGEELRSRPASVLPLAQRYFLF